MQFKVVVDFCEINMIEINVEDPESAANAVLKLFKEDRLKPQINEIAVFDIEDEFGFEPPIYVFQPSID
jgi:hypothetical protein